MTTKTDVKDVVWVALLLIAAICFSIVMGDSLFASSVLISGILCVALTAIGRIEGYAAGMYASCTYAWMAYQNGLFGEVMLNLGFFIPTNIIGFIMWRKKMRGNVVEMRQLIWRHRAMVAAAVILGTLGLGLILSRIPGQNTPYIDASTNVISIIATLLMMWRYKEQWMLYIILNTVSTAMWILRWRAGGASGDLMIVMWMIYLANAIFGYWRWHTGAKKLSAIREQEAAA
ncbi:nicotinamide mononucleotide transporter [Desulfatibacillum alkenivorans DSM 16219]|jgi:nicotinamide mononucleotide transporter|uniref:Nicotinamide riboside transporter PnuC n=1 Tax=Desulfatibacillum alkenivorans DSM 16219 TaxID=1121393 RepID=A0A1M6JZM3_9BACT|nr:nicotinamide riboside transporter PnuC [Desulfatibacillum alkenivorans]SHJ52176.1 nicotinamide mononucleotide transporter [Desulfatibacillum alkenivorans DSM 16219]